MKKGDDEFRFQYGRSGDQLTTAFQCDVCHVRNMLWRDPRESDRLLMKCLRRAILDSLWSREPGTVSSTYSRARALERYGDVLRIGQVGPRLGDPTLVGGAIRGGNFILNDFFENVQGTFLCRNNLLLLKLLRFFAAEGELTITFWRTAITSAEVEEVVGDIFDVETWRKTEV